MVKDLTTGNVTKAIISFAIPMIIGNLFQQLYNIVDTIIVGRFIGPSALAAVGSSYTVMVFLTSIIIGLCMGSSMVFSFFFGAKKNEKLKSSFFTSFVFISIVTIIINIIALAFIDQILTLINIPSDVLAETKSYLQIIFYGIGFVFIYNYFAAVLRSMGNSLVPLVFLIIAALINIVLDIIFVVPMQMGINGAALATIIAQFVSAIAIMVYCFFTVPEIRLNSQLLKWDNEIAKLIINHSVLTSVQQSIMNFGILMIQGLVNTFGVSVMAAFSAAVKIDSFAYMPVQDFGNAFSTYIAQNNGAQKYHRINEGIKKTFVIITLFCILLSSVVVIFAKNLMLIFVNVKETEVISLGVEYLRIVGIFYCFIGYLFMLYGLYRGLGRTSMSIVLTVFSLGIRVLLAYTLSAIPSIGLVGIWWAIPIGWFIADLVGVFYYLRISKQ